MALSETCMAKGTLIGAMGGLALASVVCPYAQCAAEPDTYATRISEYVFDYMR